MFNQSDVTLQSGAHSVPRKTNEEQPVNMDTDKDKEEEPVNRDTGKNKEEGGNYFGST